MTDGIVETGTSWPPLSAAVLAGGKSERMGQDKAFLPLVAGGPTLLEIVLERLRGVADDVLIVANDVARHEGYGARVVRDVIPGFGTLSGIHAALTNARHEHCLVVACDMPLLNPAVLAYMAGLPRGYDVLIPQTPGVSRQGNSGQIYQTLHAIYARRCAEPIAAQLRAGRQQVVGFFPAVQVQVVDRETLLTLDPGEATFMNTNTPEALEAARRLAAGNT
ncbi:MAG: molybdenum cofactor guanylyltransferase [Thermomicrobiales bacterium]|nr:molybdenum cofactor guanylyltransferase [Thermomicrobiales bacterium]